MKQVRLVKHIYGTDAEKIQAQVHRYVNLPVFPYPSLIVQVTEGNVEQIQLVGYAIHPDPLCEGEIEALCTPTQVQDYAVPTALDTLVSQGWNNTQDETAVNFQEVIESDVTEDPDIF